MGTIVTPPRPVAGPTTEFGWDVRNTLESEPWIKPFSEFKADVDRTLACGGTWVRLSSSPWRFGWWSGSQWLWDQARLDSLVAQVRYAHSRGLKISFTWLPGEAPELDAKAYTARCVAATTKVAQAIGRYVTIVQVYNEVNGRDFQTYVEAPPATMTAYVLRLRDIIGALGAAWKAQAPGTLVTTTLFGFPPDVWYPRWVELYDVLAPVVDVIGLSVYPARWTPSIADVPRMMADMTVRYGKPAAILETGYNATGPDIETELATYLPMLADMWSTCPVMCVIWYTIRDMGPRADVDGENRFGFYYQDGTEKPYRAQTAARCASHVQHQGCTHGDIVTMTAGASTDATVVSWRVKSGGGQILGSGPAITYLPAASAGDGQAVLGVSVDGGAEREVTVALGAHPWWSAGPDGWAGDTRGRALPH